MPTVYIDENIPLLAECLKSTCNVTKFSGRLLTNEALIHDNCDALIVRSVTKVNESLLAGTNINFIGTATAGMDHIDTAYLKKKKINFYNAPGSNANSVAEYVIYSILKWSFLKNANLENKSIGIVGFGNVGKIVGYYAYRMGMQVFVNDPPLLDSGFIFPQYANYLQLEELCSKCDIITNHVPLEKEGKYPTFRLFGSNNLSLLNPDSLFIHTSRGFVVDEAVLADKVLEKNITTIIDVWENEPDFNTALARNSLIATPHIAGYSYDGKLKGALMMARQLSSFYQIEPGINLILEELNSDMNLSLNFKDFHSIFSTLNENRQIDEDNFLFQLLYDLTIEEKKKGFDGIRKNYPVRRESLSTIY